MEQDNRITIRQIRFTVSDIRQWLNTFEKLGKKYGCNIICLNKNLIAGKKHLISAIRHAQESFFSGDAIARKFEIEVLLYAAGTRQTGVIGPFGIQIGDNECYLCVISGTQEGVDDIMSLVQDAEEEDWESISLEKEELLKVVFEISDAEIRVTGREKIQNLVLERVALLTVNR